MPHQPWGPSKHLKDAASLSIPKDHCLQQGSAPLSASVGVCSEPCRGRAGGPACTRCLFHVSQR